MFAPFVHIGLHLKKCMLISSFAPIIFIFFFNKCSLISKPKYLFEPLTNSYYLHVLCVPVPAQLENELEGRQKVGLLLGPLC